MKPTRIESLKPAALNPGRLRSILCAMLVAYEAIFGKAKPQRIELDDVTLRTDRWQYPTKRQRWWVRAMYAVICFGALALCGVMLAWRG